VPDPLSISIVVAAGAVVVGVAIRVVVATYGRGPAPERPRGADGIIVGAGPIDLASGDADAPAALLLHGFGDTPQTVSYLAADLHRRGWTVHAPLLPGHGRTVGVWAGTGGEDWLGAARTALEALRRRHDIVGLVGLSMGGALASVLAAEVGAHGRADGLGGNGGRGRDGAGEGEVAALVLVAPYFRLPTWMRLLAGSHRVVGAGRRYVGARGSPSILDPVERDRNLAYGVTTPRLVDELGRVARRAWAALPRVAMPTLLVQSHRDNRTTARTATAAFRRLASADKRLVWVDAGAHIITVDYGREHVIAAVGDWLDAHVPSWGRAREVRPA